MFAQSSNPRETTLYIQKDFRNRFDFNNVEKYARDFFKEVIIIFSFTERLSDGVETWKNYHNWSFLGLLRLIITIFFPDFALIIQFSFFRKLRQLFKQEKNFQK